MKLQKYFPRSFIPFPWSRRGLRFKVFCLGEDLGLATPVDNGEPLRVTISGCLSAKCGGEFGVKTLIKA
jgi:hypothetical protein